MDFESFEASLSESEPPAGLSAAAQALWWDAKGDWAKAHGCAQAQEDAAGAWVHAYLHRKEGDAANAELVPLRRATAGPRAARPGVGDDRRGAAVDRALGRRRRP
jgi:hypothetical protein